MTHRAQIRLAQHSWPGNVREFENVIGHAAMMTMSDMIDVQDLPWYLRTPSEQVEQTASSDHGTLEEQERMLVIRALEAVGKEGDRHEATRLESFEARRGAAGTVRTPGRRRELRYPYTA